MVIIMTQTLGNNNFTSAIKYFIEGGNHQILKSRHSDNQFAIFLRFNSEPGLAAV